MFFPLLSEIYCENGNDIVLFFSLKVEVIEVVTSEGTTLLLVTKDSQGTIKYNRGNILIIYSLLISQGSYLPSGLYGLCVLSFKIRVHGTFSLVFPFLFSKSDSMSFVGNRLLFFFDCMGQHDIAIVQGLAIF